MFHSNSNENHKNRQNEVKYNGSAVSTALSDSHQCNPWDNGEFRDLLL